MMKKREQIIDILKGMACLLVVIGHVLSGTADKLSQGTIFYYLEEFIGSFHMPLFMMASGYLYRYANSLEKAGNYGKFILKKFINLGIPYFIFSIIYILLNMLAGGDNVNTSFQFGDMLNLYRKPIAQYWFLYALFFIFVIIGILDSLIKKRRYIILAVALLFKISTIWIYYGFLQPAFGMMFYFYLGTFMVGKLNNKTFKKYIMILIYPIFVIIYTYFKTKYNFSTEVVELVKIPVAIFGIYFAIVVVNLINAKLNKIKEFLLMIYKYSFQIYVLHIFFTASTRTALIKLNISNYGIHFICGIILGVLGSIICAKISNKIVYTDLVFFPNKTWKAIKEGRSEINENSNDRA